MSEVTVKLLKLINEGKTVNEIAGALNLSNKSIYNLLATIRNKGFDFIRKYYHDGNIVYSPKKCYSNQSDGKVDIIINEDIFKAIVISDIHFGSSFERLDALNKIYDYCISKNIHIIIVCGDLIDGYLGWNDKKISNGSEQIDYLLKNYPFDKNILNFAVLGDHDESVLETVGQDLAVVLNSYRHDIVVLGYNEGQIGIKKDILTVKHGKKIGTLNKGLVLSGHSHSPFIKQSNQLCFVNIPSLSNLNFSRESREKLSIPYAYSMTIELKDGLFSNVLLKNLIVLDKVYSMSEVYLELKKSLLNPRPDLQPPVYEPPKPKNPASLDRIKTKKYKWE